MKNVINKVLRDKGIIDNGVSDILADMCNQMTYDVIKQEISFTAIAIEAMNGLLVNPQCSGRSVEAVAQMAIDHAEALHQKLFNRIDLLETPAEPTIQ